VAGTSVDLLFFPIDTIKTRLQSERGFIKAGGFKGVYKGVGSVVVGSAPGGLILPPRIFLCMRSLNCISAAIFFSTYELMKKHLAFQNRSLAPLTHMAAASLGEVVSYISTRFSRYSNGIHPRRRHA
jgi:solute carrier family 25 (mitochondrial S-adenosylmethionine transporter), member 26